MIIGTAGHIDHGKTALVRALTGVDTDRLPEEQRRGITIELGFAPLALEGIGTAGIVDVPGHEAFVRTMVAGATGVDVALLVVAADEGVMPQTREHLAVLGLLGVTRGVVALTKRDLVDDEWLALAAEDVRETLATTALRDAPVIAVSARTGEGIGALREALAAAASVLPSRDSGDLSRLPVDRAFSVRGTGTVVTGTLWSGAVRRDDQLHLYPGDRTVRVRGLQQHGAAVDVAHAGARVAVALGGAELAELARGAVLLGGEGWAASPLLRAEVRLHAADVRITPRTRLQLHLGTSEVTARLVARGEIPRDGTPVPVRIALDEPLVARAGDRFVLRAPAPLGTIGGGVVTDPQPPRRARPWPLGAPPAERLRLLVLESAGAGLPLASLPVRLGVTPGAAAALAVASGLAHVGDRLFDPGLAAGLRDRVLAAVADFHAARPLEPAVPTAALRALAPASPSLVDQVLAALQREGELAPVPGGVVRAGFTPGLTPELERLAGSIVASLASARLEPPTTAELAQALAADPVPILRHLERQGEVVQVADGWWFAKRPVEELVGLLRVEMEREREYSPSELRERLGLSRKYLIPVLEYCDRVGVTTRKGNNRILRS